MHAHTNTRIPLQSTLTHSMKAPSKRGPRWMHLLSMLALQSRGSQGFQHCGTSSPTNHHRSRPPSASFRAMPLPYAHALHATTFSGYPHHHHHHHHLCGHQSCQSQQRWHQRQYRSPLQARQQPCCTRLSSILRSSRCDDESWTVGDVDGDFMRLEYAINLNNAWGNRKSMERREEMDELSRQERPVFRDAKNFVLIPLVATAFLTMACKRSSAIQRIASIFHSIVDLHFLLVVVACPILMLGLKKLTMPKPEPMPDELKELGELRDLVMSSLSIPIDWVDPLESCKDRSLVLLEYWWSAVWCMGLVTMLARIAGITNNASVRVWLSLSQFFTRLGALSSLFGCGTVLFDVQRKDQERPIGFFPTYLQKMIKSTTAWARMGLISDLSKVLTGIPARFSYGVYGTVMIAAAGAMTRLVQPKDEDTEEPRDKPKRVADAERLLLGSLWIAMAWDAIKRFPWHSLKRQFLRVPRICSLTVVGASFLAALPFIPAWFHISHLIRQTSVLRQDNVSLSLLIADPERYQKEIDAPENAPIWRYTIFWNDPVRLNQVMMKWEDEFYYNLLIKGCPEDIMRKQMQEIARQEDLGNQEWYKIVDRAMNQKEPSEIDVPLEKCKENAMASFAKKHAEHLKSRKHEDPLGVAVYSMLGIGLGLNFDHMSELEPGKVPSGRRLQARAAKSAILRAKQLKDPNRILQATQHVTDENEKAAIRDRMQKEAKEEIEAMAQRLTDLIPTGFSDESEGEAKVSMREYRRVSATEMVVVDPDKDNTRMEEPQDEVVRALLQEGSRRSKDGKLTENADEAFLSAYMDYVEKKKAQPNESVEDATASSQREGGEGSSGNDNDGDDTDSDRDGPEMVIT